MPADKTHGRSALGWGLWLAAAVASAPAAAGGRIDFDRGVDIKSLTQALREGAALQEDPAATRGPEWATRDCATIAFKYGDPSPSSPAALRSQVFRTECSVIYGREHCEDRLQRTETRNVSVAFKGTRNLYPWETEAFVACLEGPRLEAEIARAAHDYRLRVKAGAEATVIEAEARKKLRTDPDPSGVGVASFAQTPSGGISLVLADKWASYYKGEKTVVSFTLKHEKRGWFDETLHKGRAAFAAADSYAVDFGALPEVRARLTPGERYYATWEFRREGKVSTSKTHSGGETTRIVYSIAAP